MEQIDLRSRARRAYELGRARAGAKAAGAALLLAAVAVVLGRPLDLTALLSAALMPLVFVLAFRGRAAGRAVWPGLAAGGAAMLLPLAVRTAGCELFGPSCMRFCLRDEHRQRRRPRQEAEQRGDAHEDLGHAGRDRPCLARLDADLREHLAGLLGALLLQLSQAVVDHRGAERRADGEQAGVLPPADESILDHQCHREPSFESEGSACSRGFSTRPGWRPPTRQPPA